MPPYAGPPVASRSGDAASPLRLLAYLALAITLIVLDDQAGWLARVREQANKLVQPVWVLAGLPGKLGSQVKDTAAEIRGIGGVIGETRAVVTTIATAVNEQNAATSEIARNVNEAASSVRSAADGIAAVSKTTEEARAAAGAVDVAAGSLSAEVARLNGIVEDLLRKMRSA